uniref:PRY domain-containing protein n=1 Tax=Steinernema glaseri TaxID=37863 RepID=A0A1I8APZ9_9BILA
MSYLLTHLLSYYDRSVWSAPCMILQTSSYPLRQLRVCSQSITSLDTVEHKVHSRVSARCPEGMLLSVRKHHATGGHRHESNTNLFDRTLNPKGKVLLELREPGEGDVTGCTYGGLDLDL